MVNELDNTLPDPELVARAAAEEAAPRLLEDYNEAIEILRDKKFTFREIANWLNQKFGIQADHNSVWRAYTKYMSDLDAHEEAEADEELEREEGMAMAEANGTLSVSSHSTAASAEPKPVERVVELAKAKKLKKK